MKSPNEVKPNENKNQNRIPQLTPQEYYGLATRAAMLYTNAAKLYVGSHHYVKVCMALGDLYSDKSFSEYNLDRAIQLYNLVSGTETGNALNRMGEIYETELISKDNVKAFQYYELAASNHNNLKAMLNLYRIVKANIDVPANKQKADEYKTQIGNYHYQLGRKNLESNPKEALENFEDAMKWENTEAYQFVIDGYQTGLFGVVDVKKAMEYTAKLNDIYYHIAQCLEQGNEQDKMKAVEYYQKGHTRNHAKSIYALGRCARDGIGGMFVIPEFAVGYFQQAADLGLRDAQYQMGNSYENGLGVTAHFGAAVEHYRAAAKQGHTGSMVSLGSCYERGDKPSGFAPEPRQALHWYYTASRENFAPAFNRIALCFRNRIGVEFSNVSAAENFARANELGNIEYQRRFVELQPILIMRDTMTVLFDKWRIQPAKTVSNTISDFAFETEEDKKNAEEFMKGLAAERAAEGIRRTKIKKKKKKKKKQSNCLIM